LWPKVLLNHLYLLLQRIQRVTHGERGGRFWLGQREVDGELESTSTRNAKKRKQSWRRRDKREKPQNNTFFIIYLLWHVFCEY
jgi:hypothetical protein